MAQAVLTQILNDMNTLDAHELRAVEQAAQERLQQQQTTMGYSEGEWAVLQAMLKAGLLTEIKPKKQFDSDEERPFIYIKGQLLSETIIEERR